MKIYHNAMMKCLWNFQTNLVKGFKLVSFRLSQSDVEQQAVTSRLEMLDM